MTLCLEARGVGCAYGKHRVLEDFDLEVGGGEVVALLGPNGAGKTTALRALARLLRPRQGRITLGGREIWRIPGRDYSQQVAYAPQFQNLEWGLSVADTVTLGRAPHRGWFLPYTIRDGDVVARVLEKMGLEPLRERRIDTLSGGEQRRVLLARTLAQEAQVLLLDEPTAHLDLRYQVETLDLLKRLSRDRELAVVVSLHDLNQAALWADRVALLRAGRLLAQGEVAAVLTADRLARTYDVAVEVLSHPDRGRPLIVAGKDGGHQSAPGRDPA